MADTGIVQYILHLKGREKATSVGRHLFVSAAHGLVGGTFGFFVWNTMAGVALGFFVIFAIYEAAVAIQRACIDDELVRLQYTCPNEFREAEHFIAMQPFVNKHKK